MSMHESKRFSRNIVAPIAQVLISGGVLFVLYRFLYDELGVAQIGVWSLVMAATSVSRIGELGLSAGIVRFVAQSLGQQDEPRAAEVIQTTAITLSLGIGALLLAGWPLIGYSLPLLLPAGSVPIALQILPMALMSIWLMVLTSVFSGALDGCLRMDLRSMLTATSQLLYLGMALILVPEFGLRGIAWAQLIQYLTLMLGLWLLLRKQIKCLPVIPYRWRAQSLREIFGYGVRFQVITITSMLFDPMIKVLVSKFGGVDTLGFYEMANRLVLQCRGIIIEASRVLVPTIAALQNCDDVQIRRIFTTAYSLNFYVSILLYSLLGISMSVISILWLGHLQKTFVLFALMLSLGWFGNTIIGPSYFSNLGSGRLRENMISHILMSVISGLSALALGVRFGGAGVAAGVTLGLLGGGVFLLIAHMRQLDLNWPSFLIPQHLLPLLIAGIVLSLVSNYWMSEQASLLTCLVTAAACAAVLLGIMYPHPSRAALVKFKLR